MLLRSWDIQLCFLPQGALQLKNYLKTRSKQARMKQFAPWALQSELPMPASRVVCAVVPTGPGRRGQGCHLVSPKPRSTPPSGPRPLDHRRFPLSSRATHARRRAYHRHPANHVATEPCPAHAAMTCPYCDVLSCWLAHRLHKRQPPIKGQDPSRASTRASPSAPLLPLTSSSLSSLSSQPPNHLGISPIT
jgi:hypothetical protein